jgi:hypothetical protein
MPDIQRELIPHEHSFIDIPRHLAIITSAIVRHSRDVSPEDPAMVNLFKRCRDVERRALHYVNRSRGGGTSAARLPAPDSGFSSVTSNLSPITTAQSLSPPKARASSHSRPRTAPSAAMSDPALHTLAGRRLSQEVPLPETELNKSPAGAEASTEDDSWAALRRQASRPRSVSTDSVPDFRSTVEVVRPERKKGFLRNIWNRK